MSWMKSDLSKLRQERFLGRKLVFVVFGDVVVVLSQHEALQEHVDFRYCCHYRHSANAVATCSSGRGVGPRGVRPTQGPDGDRDCCCYRLPGQTGDDDKAFARGASSDRGDSWRWAGASLPRAPNFPFQGLLR